MILLLDTSTSVCKLTIAEPGGHTSVEWDAGRELARGLLAFLETELAAKGKTFDDITGIGALKGPGSFTGLRIGLTVLNTLADSLSISIVGETGDDWQTRAITRLEEGENERFVMPLYGGEANITPPRK